MVEPGLWVAAFASAFCQHVEAHYQAAWANRDCQYYGKCRAEIANAMRYGIAESASSVADAAVKGLIEFRKEEA